MINDKGVRSSVDHLDFSQPPRSYEPLIVEELLYKENKKKNRSKVYVYAHRVYRVIEKVVMKNNFQDGAIQIYI